MKILHLKKIHFGTLIFLLVNVSMGVLTSYSLNTDAIFVIKIVLYVSGVLLFFLSIRPFRWIAIYFSIFVVAPAGLLISWIADGILGAILSSVFLGFWTPPVNLATDHNFTLKKNFSGFMASCCSYSVHKTELGIVELKMIEFRYEQTWNKSNRFQIDGDKAIITFKNLDNDDQEATLVFEVR